jgi:hypothetical protein
VLGDFQSESLPATLGRIGGNPQGANPRRPTDRISESFGTARNPDPFLLTEDQINGAKGSLFHLQAPSNQASTMRAAELAVSNRGTAAQVQDSINAMFAHVRAVCVIIVSLLSATDQS